MSGIAIFIIFSDRIHVCEPLILTPYDHCEPATKSHIPPVPEI